MIRFDQGSQFTSGERHSFTVTPGDRTYLTRDAARQGLFENIEMFCNLAREHINNGILSPIDYEKKQRKMVETGVQEN